MKTAAESQAYGAANRTPDKRLQFQICLSDAEPEPTTWSFADPEPVMNQLDKKTYGITLKEQKRFKKEFSICLIEFEVWWETVSTQALSNTIEQRGIHFGYGKMYHVSHR